MIEFKSGATRNIIILKSLGIVVKFPIINSWYGFLTGIISNLNEIDIWKNGVWAHLLCPILFWIPGGFFLVMRYAELLTIEEYFDIVSSDEYADYLEVSKDDHIDNYGKIDGDKIVWIDYA